MKYNLLLYFLLFFSFTFGAFGFSGEVDLKTMTMQERLEFLKENKDLYKNTSDFSYSKYLNSEWVGITGTITSQSGSKIENKNIEMFFNGDKHSTLTNQDGRFFFNIKKSNIKDQYYFLEFWLYPVKSSKLQVYGKNLTENSIFDLDFIEIKTKNNIHYQINEIHNSLLGKNELDSIKFELIKGKKKTTNLTGLNEIITIILILSIGIILLSRKYIKDTINEEYFRKGNSIFILFIIFIILGIVIYNFSR